MQVNPSTTNRRGNHNDNAGPSRKKMKAHPNEHTTDDNTDPLLSAAQSASSSANNGNEFESVANDAVKVAAAAAAAKAAGPSGDGSSHTLPSSSSSNNNVGNTTQPHMQPTASATAAESSSHNDGVIDNELLKDKTGGNYHAATNQAVANALGNHDQNTFQQILLNHDLPHTNQVLQQRLNSPLAREFRNQFTGNDPTAAGTDPNAPHSLATVGDDGSHPDDHNKPDVGSPAWHKQRRDNHKEVERRRRETINKGIEKIAEIVPECEKQKSQILQRAYEYILKLKANESTNMEKFALEKLLTEQAIAELTNSNNRLRTEIQNAWRDVEHWKHVCLKHGIDIQSELPPERESSATAGNSDSNQLPSNNSNNDNNTSNDNNSNDNNDSNETKDNNE